MYCVNCGKQIDDNAYACPYCGVKVYRKERAVASAGVEKLDGKAKQKKAFNIVANVCTIVLMSFVCISSLVIILGLSPFLIPDFIIFNITFGVLSIIFGIVLLYSIVTIVMAALALANSKGDKGKGFKIAVIVLMSIVAAVWFMGSGIFFALICFIPIGFEIASLSIKTQAPAPEIAAPVYTAPSAPVYTPPAPSSAPEKSEPSKTQTAPEKSATTTDEKIIELRRLKETGAITEEQYDKAIMEILNNI